MTKTEAMERITAYLRQRRIPFRSLMDEERILSFHDLSSQSIYLCTIREDVIGSAIETMIRFEEDYCYFQFFFAQPIIHTEKEESRAARICNYMNVHLQWNCNSLFNHTYLYQDEGELYNECLIRYDLLELYFQEAMDHLLHYGVQQMADVCVPVVSYLTGRFSYEDCKHYLETNVMGN